MYEIFSLKGIVFIWLIAFIKYFFISNNVSNVLLDDFTVNFSIPNFLIFIFSGILVSIFHEFAHGIACKRYGGEVDAMGVLLYFFVPTMYCDVSDIYMLGKRKISFCVGMAGVSANVLTGSIAAIIYAILFGC